jgi:hypothetical protein
MSFPTTASANWITMGIGGQYAYLSSGDVVEVKTKKIVAQMKDEYGKPMHSEKYLEMAFSNGKLLRTVSQFGEGIPSAVQARLAGTEPSSHSRSLSRAVRTSSPAGQWLRPDAAFAQPQAKAQDQQIAHAVGETAKGGGGAPEQKRPEDELLRAPNLRQVAARHLREKVPCEKDARCQRAWPDVIWNSRCSDEMTRRSWCDRRRRSCTSGTPPV